MSRTKTLVAGVGDGCFDVLFDLVRSRGSDLPGTLRAHGQRAASAP